MTDTELLDYLQSLNDKQGFTGRCILRMSASDRGWRLHETRMDGATTNVREAIEQFIKNENEKLK